MGFLVGMSDVCVSSVHQCPHLWYLSGLVVNALFVGQHKRIYV